MNPTPYTIITFPFLFAIMFGDFGHGTLMALFGAWMVMKEKPLSAKKSDNEIWNIFFGGRYIILLMGVFSMYTGLIYNDVFSKSVNIFGSSWKIGNLTYNYTQTVGSDHMLDPATIDYEGYPYPFGLDPVWQLAKNKIIFLNSFKMKLSIIIGITHMLFGVAISYFKNMAFGNRLNIICEFIPQVIFLSFLFFYMVLLMFIKWFMYYPDNDLKNVVYGTRCAPSILITFINMVLNKETPYEKICETSNMYAGQGGIQKFLLFCAFVCIPWMLLAKPIIIMRRRKAAALYPVNHNQLSTGATENGDAEQPMHNSTAQPPAPVQGGGEHDDEPMSEIFIHQGIHTIEYVLGSISHTASYLRLWALSLAHAQLSEVLWGMVLNKGLTVQGWTGGVALYLIFAVWGSLTVSILVLMEGLSAFLHTLRLHWVEFCSKFYSGGGYAFQPFSFEVILESAGQGKEE